MNELLPIIRRKRRPLVVETNVEMLKPEILKAVPVKVEEDGTKMLQAESERRLTSAATETTAPDANVTPKRKKR